MTSKNHISVLILTLNEEINIEACVRSISWCDDIIVLDSGSTDSTVEIAELLGCRVFHRKFDNWSQHQNWAIRNLPFRHEWVFNLDADERVDGDLAEELAAAASNPHGCVAFKMRRKDFFRDTWLKHATFYPTWFTRSDRKSRV